MSDTPDRPAIVLDVINYHDDGTPGEPLLTTDNPVLIDLWNRGRDAERRLAETAGFVRKEGQADVLKRLYMSRPRPLTLPALVRATDWSRSTVRRRLRELCVLEFVCHLDDKCGYALTAAGLEVAERFFSLGKD